MTASATAISHLVLRVLLGATLVGPQLLLTASTAGAAPADTYYVVHLSRIAQDAYRDWSDNLVVITNSCLSLTLGDDVFYDDSARELIFPDGESCYVQGIYRPSIQLTRISQDLYRDTGGRGYLRTRYCYAYAYSEDVVLLSDSVIFLSTGERCDLAPL